jgi:periplasmic divalent cation tolerance protein
MFYVVLTMAKNPVEAKKISEKLVSEKLAACVSSVSGAKSVYRWKGKVERADEVLLLAKTSKKKLGPLISRIRQLHSYEVPEILALKVERGSPDYLRWIEESLR